MIKIARWPPIKWNTFLGYSENVRLIFGHSGIKYNGLLCKDGEGLMGQNFKYW